jgi:predicted transcriptional regulator
LKRSSLALLAFLRGHWDTFLEPVRKRGRAARANDRGVTVLEHYGLIKWKQELELGRPAFVELE